MMIGGGTKEQRKTVMMFEPDSHEKFDESVPSLIHEAYDAGCAVFKSAMHNYRLVVLSVGGQGGSFAEVYDYTKPNSTWIESKIHMTYLSRYMYSRVIWVVELKNEGYKVG